MPPYSLPFDRADLFSGDVPFERVLLRVAGHDRLERKAGQDELPDLLTSAALAPREPIVHATPEGE